MPKAFDAIDSDKDGVATPAELRAFFERNAQTATSSTKTTLPAVPRRPGGSAARREIPANVEKRAISIWSDGTKMVGDLYLPKDRKDGERLPAVVFCSGTGGTKKGSPSQLGPIFAAAGYAFLGFDYRGWGDSDAQIFITGAMSPADENGEVTVKGKPIRWQMNFADQTADIRSAIAWLAGAPEIDPARIGIMGSSYGGGLVTWVAAHDPRVKCVAAQVSGMGGSRGEAAERRAFELLSKQARGESEPIPFETGKLGGKMATYANMRVNPAKNIGFNAVASAEKIRVPMILIDAEKEDLMDIRENGGKVAGILKTNGVPVEYHIIPDITHYGIYREGFEQATKLELAWFDKHLKGTPVPHPSSPVGEIAARFSLSIGRQSASHQPTFTRFSSPHRPRAGVAVFAAAGANGERLLHGAAEGVLIHIADIMETPVANRAGFGL